MRNRVIKREHNCQARQLLYIVRNLWDRGFTFFNNFYFWRTHLDF
jgi:hypothetical protein